jgi:adenylosuccinate lyase
VKGENPPEALAADLDTCWEVLAEAVQTIMRKHGCTQPYEQLKALTRGHAITREEMHAFIRSLDLPEDEQELLLGLTPATYIGRASQLVRHMGAVPCCKDRLAHVPMTAEFPKIAPLDS